MVRNFITFAIRAKLPCVVRTNNVVTHDVGAAVVDHHIRGRVVRAQMRLHVRAVSVEQNYTAGSHAAVEREVLTKKAHSQGLVRVEFSRFSNHEPTARVGEFA